MTVHVFHVGFCVLEGVGEHRVFRLEVFQTAVQVVVLHFELLHFLSLCSDTVRHETFDDLLRTVAVLESIDESQLRLTV